MLLPLPPSLDYSEANPKQHVIPHIKNFSKNIKLLIDCKLSIKQLPRGLGSGGGSMKDEYAFWQRKFTNGSCKLCASRGQQVASAGTNGKEVLGVEQWGEASLLLL